ncbi:hypothetical protein HMPREF0043_02304 [Actinobaculum sp. oral taxon 183 str. F0552]|nr:hypothetical protein HMPREF0043_02304 [Actinobaculum sp. oral taxon 183 str. F0552]
MGCVRNEMSFILSLQSNTEAHVLKNEQKYRSITSQCICLSTVSIWFC